MIPQGVGRIINIGSNFGVIAFKGRAVYAAAKAGVHHLSRALSRVGEARRSSQCRGGLHHRNRESQERLERPGYKDRVTNEMIPRGRWNQPEDLVGAVLFFSSDMSDMVVGHVLMVDGGWTLH
jgi:2-deoxy-D-gluconate 3-dehydrogenase